MLLMMTSSALNQQLVQRLLELGIDSGVSHPPSPPRLPLLLQTKTAVFFCRNGTYIPIELGIDLLVVVTNFCFSSFFHDTIATYHQHNSKTINVLQVRLPLLYHIY